MWFGTGASGLDRYDGYSITVYKNNPSDLHSLSHNNIHKLLEDREGNLWIGSRGGVCQYDRKLDRFIVYMNDTVNPNFLSSNDVRSIYQDYEGVLWIGTTQGLDRFDRSKSTIIHYRNNPKDPNTISNNYISDIIEDDQGRLWICTQGGLNVLDKKTQTITRYIHNPTNINSLSHNICSAIYKDNLGNLWISTLGGGLNRLDLKTGKFQRYQHSETDRKSLSADRVLSLSGDGKGNLFIGTENGGLNIYDQTHDRFICYLPNPDEPSSINSNSIPSMYFDTNGILWIGTQNSGVNFSSAYLQRFTLIQNKKRGLNNSIVLGLLEDRKGNMWIGTDGGGLDCWNRKTNQFSYYLNNPKDPTSIGSDAVLSVFEDSKNRLWAGAYRGGLNLINRTTGHATRFMHDSKTNKSLIDDVVRKIFEDRQNNLWVATDSGLVRLNPDGKTFTSINDLCGSRLQLFNLTSLVEDWEGNLWVGGYGTGLYCFTPDRRSYIRYIPEFDNVKSFSSYDVLSIYVDSKGGLWIGTNKGLDQFNPKDKTFVQYTIEDGLPDNKVVSILEDNKNNLWLGTTKGISTFTGAVTLPLKPEFHNFDMLDGVQGYEFRVGSCFKAHNGEMFFGGNNGFNVFLPDQAEHNPMAPPVVLSGFKLFNKDVPIGKPNSPLRQRIDVSDSIILSYKNSVFTFDFAALNYLLPEKNQYAFIMEGFEKEWNYVGNQRSATYTNLNSGSYTFRVKASNNDGIWNMQGTSIHIIITPPFWQTIWFRLILLTVFVAVSYWVYNWRVQVRDLAAQRQIDRMKLQFFANVSHEIRTPLTLILGPLQSLIAKKENKYLEYAYNNAKKLSQLIDQLLDFQKVVSGRIQLELLVGDMVRFLQMRVDYFRPQAVEHHLDLKFISEQYEIYCWFDPEKFEIIINNLIMNALKFTPKGGKIEVRVASKKGIDLGLHNTHEKKQHESKVEISISDTGLGISKQDLNHVYEYFYQAETSSKVKTPGSGIGLALVKQLVELHHGKIAVESEVGKGTTFTISLPYEDDRLASIKTEQPARIHTQNQIHELNDEMHPIQKQNVGDSSREKPVILIVEDNNEFRSFLMHELQSLYNVMEANDGVEGLKIALSYTPDVIISDIMMPEMDGVELTKNLKTNLLTCHIPVILLTAKKSVEHELEGLEAHADEYITKPFNMQALNQRIHNLIQSRIMLRERFIKEIHLHQINDAYVSLDEKFLKNTIEFIERNMEDQNFGVEVLSNLVGMSRRNLYNKITSLTGLKPNEFIRLVRLKQAARFLKESQLTVSQICFQVGFNHMSSFHKYFKLQFGVSPGSFREQV